MLLIVASALNLTEFNTERFMRKDLQSTHHHFFPLAIFGEAMEEGASL